MTTTYTGKIIINNISVNSNTLSSLLKTTIVNTSTSTVITGSSETTIFSFSYTPQSSNSLIEISINSSYNVSGSNEITSFTALLKVDGTSICSRQINYNGTDVQLRTNNIFPMVGMFTNNNTTSKTITMTVQRNSGSQTWGLGENTTNTTVNIPSTQGIIKVNEYNL